MKLKHIVIYIPGIRDDIGRLQTVLIQSWRLFGVRPIMHQMPWAGRDGFEPKLQRLLGEIDRYTTKGYRVSLVAASAGATAALHAFVRRKSDINGVVFVCGKINNPHPPRSRVYADNAAYEMSLRWMPEALAQLNEADTVRLLSLYSEIDTIVPPTDTIIPGVRKLALKPRRHGWAILTTISLRAAVIVHFLKAQAK